LQQELYQESKRYALKRLQEEADYIKSRGLSTVFHYRKEHTLTVVGLARKIAEKTGADMLTCEVGAWFHDLGKCYDSRLSPEDNRKRQKNHGLYGAEEAREFLSQKKADPDFIEEVYIAIKEHVGLTRKENKPMTPLSAAVIWDADKLSKIGWSAWLHFLAYTCNREREEQSLLELLHRDGLETMEMIFRNLNTEIAKKMAEKRLENYQKNLLHMEGVLRGEI